MNRSLLLALGGLSITALAQNPCEEIKALAFPDTVIAEAAIVPAGPYRPPGPGGADAQQAALQLPAHCRVIATLKPTSDSEIGIEVWMPASDWNGKFQAVGGGGWAGVISYGAMALALEDGYATASTDTGHKGGDAVFALGHAERVIDFSWRAVHEMTVKAKAFITTFYGRAPRFSYWNGCSTGGRQGLMEAQRYPEDFDGIVAGAPANYQTHLHAWSVAVAMATMKNKESALTPADLELLNKAALAACDALDGVKDGILTDPRQCHFDPASLRCRTSGAENCLTDAQVEAVKKIYAPLKTKSGTLIFPSMVPGSELGWSALAGGPEPMAVATGTFKYVSRQDPKWDWHTFDADKDTELADSSDIINATNPDLRAFQSRGGKLLMYHGWNDQLIAPENSINYYSSVLEKMGKEQGEWYRLFMIPGMQHCRGGPGPNQFNMMGVIERWREANIAPDQITASHVANNRVDMTRPLCPYPQVAEWKGIGNTNDAANFVCRLPK